MNKKMILLASLLLFLILPFKINSIDAFGAVRTLDLEEAIDRALSNNSSINLLKEKIDLAERKARDASGLDRDKKEKELKDLEYELDQKEEEVEIEVVRLYHSILIKKDQIDLQEKVVDRLSREYEIKLQQLEQGKATEIDVALSHINISEGENKLQSLEKELEGLIMDLNIIMGNDPSNSLRLKNEPMPEARLKIRDIEELADEMVEGSPEIESLIEEKRLKSRDSDTDWEAILELEYDIEDKRTDVRSRVYTGYNDVLNKKDDVSIKELDYERLQKLAEAAKIRFDHGIISEVEYDKAEQDAENAYNLLLLSKLDYYVEIKKYKLFIEPVQ